MKNINKTATQRTITAEDLFISVEDAKAQQKAEVKRIQAVKKYGRQVLGLLHSLAILEDAVRTGRVSGVRATPEYSAVLTELKKVSARALKADASSAFLWAEKCAVYGVDLLNY